jgi:hypothetical protein
MLGAVPSGAKQVLLPQDQQEAWAEYMVALADQLDVANHQALSWYDAMRDGLQAAGIPLFSPPSFLDGTPVAWTKDLDQKLLDVSSMVEHAALWLREVAVGKRALFLQGDTVTVEAKEEDPFQIVNDPQTNTPIMVAGAVQVHDTGTLGAAPIVIAGAALPIWLVGVGIVIAGAVTLARCYVIYQLIVGIVSIIQGILAHENLKTVTHCLETVADPADCHKSIEAVRELAVATKPPEPAGPRDWAAAAEKIAKALALGAVVIGGVYLGVTTVPPLLAEWKSNRARAPRERADELSPAGA